MTKTIILCSLLLACALQIRADTYPATYASFEGISNTLPIPGTIEVSTNKEYRIVVEGSSGVINALNIRLESNKLIIDYKRNTGSVDLSKANFKLYVPAGVITNLAHTGSALLKVDGTIFTPAKAEISAAGAGSLVVSKAAIAEITLKQSGSGTVIIDGSPARITISVSGSGVTYLVGVTAGVVIDGSGSGKLYVDGKGSSVAVSGSASGTFTVSYTSGSCGLSQAGRVSCSRVDRVDVPSL